MKVLIVNSLYYPNIIGGAERSTQILAENLEKFGIKSVIMTVADEDKEDNINGIKVYYVKHRNIYWSYHSKTRKSYLKPVWHLLSLYNPFILKKAYNIIKKETPDVVHTNNLSEFTAGIWRVVKKNNTPLMHTLRDYALICPRAVLFRRGEVCSSKNLICRMMIYFKRYFADLPDVVTGNSNFILKKHLEEGFFSKAKKYVVYNSLSSEEVRASKKTGSNVNFGFIGQLSHHKGIEFLLEVFKNKKNINIDVFGKGITPDYEKYLNERFCSKNILFFGFTPIEEAFRKIDILIVPSLWHDPLPRVIYEAYSYGIPVIASNRGGNSEIIDNGSTGYVYEADSQSDLIRKIEMFITDPAKVQKMRDNCLRKARDFLPEKSVKKYADIYKRMAKHQRLL